MWEELLYFKSDTGALKDLVEMTLNLFAFSRFKAFLRRQFLSDSNYLIPIFVLAYSTNCK